ncbi:lipase family protein [Streptomyces sp. XM4193]|uniref:lipase family protein n=1 Tax=Streptomyces sp. XM4193 TaxID=2929782 RepID=UPI001FFA3E41|nr:lipase family protein [Streptomyces sp. XM4193]MCK1795319.1 lipase family protein [Streptomyces sp. XM4193]
MKSRTLRRMWATGLMLATAASFGLVAAPAAHAEERPPFYEPPAELPAGNGEVIRTEPAEVYLDPNKALKVPADVHRVMYRSTDGRGEPLAVTGTVLTPNTPWIGKGERPIVGYTFGTLGVGDQCAASRQMAEGTAIEAALVQALLLRGYAVAVSDMEGGGTPGVHTYVNREATGNAMLDVVRAAQRLPEAKLPDNGPVGLVGYSQGGGASASAAELAATYAPELDIRGASAGAPPATLDALVENLDGSDKVGFLGYAVVGLAAGYDIDLDSYLNDAGKKFAKDAETLCNGEMQDAHQGVRSEDLTVDGRSLAQIMTEEPWAGVVAEQAIGERPPGFPMLINHSRFDEVIPFEVGQGLKADWCAGGTTVKHKPNVAPNHVSGAVFGFPGVLTWLEGRFAGLPAPSSC